jgi:hypothetical protein
MKKLQLFSILCLSMTFGLSACDDKDDGGSTGQASGTTDPTGGEEDPTGAEEDPTGAEEDPTGAEEDPSGAEEDGFFVDAGDSGGVDCGTECDPWAQDCPDGEKCTPRVCAPGATAWDYDACVPVAGEGQPGDECQQVGDGPHEDDCGSGAMCWNYDEEGVGICTALCIGSAEAPECADNNTNCVIANQGVLPLCLPKCDPLEQDCENGDLCIPSFTEEEFLCVLDSSGEMAPYGTGCEYANSCNAGLICATTEFVGEASCGASSGCCSPFCDLSDPGFECPGAALGQECVQWFEDSEVYPDIGVCLIPEEGG